VTLAVGRTAWRRHEEIAMELTHLIKALSGDHRPGRMLGDGLPDTRVSSYLKFSDTDMSGSLVRAV
jgi:hypothetical protein